MSGSRAETEQRLDRLTGAGEGSGGGLPLPDLFSAFLIEMLDGGPASAGHLVKIAAGKLEYKTARVMDGWGSWEALADDVLQQMATRGIVGDTGSAWKLGSKFETGKRLVIVPKRPGKNSNSIGITVFTREEREKRDQAADARMQLTEYVGILDRGLRRVRPKRVDEIRQSIAEFGDHRNVFPVMVDEQGRVLDGHHRRAVDPQWPAIPRPLRFRSDEERLQVALIANDSARWSVEDWRRLAALREAVGGQQSKRERIREALAGHPDDSHNKIAKMLGLHNTAVDRVCKEVTQCVTSPYGDGSYTCRHGLTGQGARSDQRDPGQQQAATPKPPPLTPEQEDGVTEMVAQGATIKEIGTHLGIGEITARDARNRALGRLEERTQPAAETGEPAAEPEPSPPPKASTHRPHAARAGRSAPALVTTLMNCAQKFLGLWAEDAPEPEPSAELRELEELRRVIDERIAALQQ